MPQEAELEVEFRYFNCSGHGPDEYCYCGYESKREQVQVVAVENHTSNGKKRKQPIVVAMLQT